MQLAKSFLADSVGRWERIVAKISLGRLRGSALVDGSGAGVEAGFG